MNQKAKAAEFVQEGYGFNVTVTGRNVQVTDAMKAYAMEKIAKIERFSTRIIDLVMTMDIQKLDHRVDIMIKLNDILIKSHAVSENMYASIDLAIDKIQSQIRRYKRRLQDHQAKPHSEAIEMTVNVLRPNVEQYLVDINDEIEDENLQ